jgi:hypothetical protein
MPDVAAVHEPTPNGSAPREPTGTDGPRRKRGRPARAAAEAGESSEPKTRRPRRRRGRTKKAKSQRTARSTRAVAAAANDFPRHSVEKALRIPKAILDQNAGKDCTDSEAASFVGVKLTGPFKSEVASSLKYGLLSRPANGRVAVTDTARKILRPQSPVEKTEGLREATLHAPVIADVYTHYRGENLPDPEFFHNALVDKFKVPTDKVKEFREVFQETLGAAGLLEPHGDRVRVLDIAQQPGAPVAAAGQAEKLAKTVSVDPSDSCFVMMSFAEPIGAYYSTIYEPAIRKAKLRPIRADSDIFGTGKIMDQIWQGMHAARVLVAELTGKNANVYYELGVAHALKKPVVLVAASEADVPFDIRQIRVIYYDVTDPFWGQKLIEKVAENILSALQNPEEATLKIPLAS